MVMAMVVVRMVVGGNKIRTWTEWNKCIVLVLMLQKRPMEMPHNGCTLKAGESLSSDPANRLTRPA